MLWYAAPAGLILIADLLPVVGTTGSIISPLQGSTP